VWRRSLFARISADDVDQLQPTSAVYARYSPDAQFHDPIGLAKGLDAVKAQFNGTYPCPLHFCVYNEATLI
jgi:hypothetical protein